MWTDRLRLVLRLNATTSAIGGLIAAVAAGWVSDTFGIDHVLITRLVGIGLVAFAGYVVWVSTLPKRRLLAETRLISAGDAGWVVATIVVLAAQILTTAGIVVAAVIGLAVADFGLTQLWMRGRAVAAGSSGPALASSAAGS